MLWVWDENILRNSGEKEYLNDRCSEKEKKKRFKQMNVDVNIKGSMAKMCKLDWKENAWHGSLNNGISATGMLL